MKTKILFTLLAVVVVAFAWQNTCLAKVTPVHGEAVWVVMPAVKLMGDTLPPRELYVMEGETLVSLDGVSYASNGCWR